MERESEIVGEGGERKEEPSFPGFRGETGGGEVKGEGVRREAERGNESVGEGGRKSKGKEKVKHR